MNIITYVDSISDLHFAHENGVREILVEHSGISRFGTLNSEDLNLFLLECKKLSVDVVLNVDILVADDQLDRFVSILGEIDLTLLKAIRVYDLGILNYVLRSLTIKVQIILENGCRNFESLLSFENVIGERLDRFVLSSEMDKESIEAAVSRIKTPVEVLLLGRLLLMYTPRTLLSYRGGAKDIEILASSEESLHKGFRLIENTHGTFMFHIKDFSLLDYVDTLEEIGSIVLRVDLRFNKDFSIIKRVYEFLNSKDEHTKNHIVKDYGEELTRGYFLANRSDILFPKLKNERMEKGEESLVGEVISVERDEYLVVRILSKDLFLKAGEVLHFASPMGKDINARVTFVKNSELEDTESLKYNSIALINYVKNVPSRTLFYRLS